MHRRDRRSYVVLGLVLALASVGCGATSREDSAQAGEASLADGPTRYDCFGVVATEEDLQTAPTVAELDHPGAPAVAEFTGGLDGWLGLEVGATRLGAIRPLDPPDELDGEVRDHERVVVELVGEQPDGEPTVDGWMVMSAGPCSLRADLGALGAATLLLAPDETLDPSTTTLHLWVVERACASGQPATGRVRLATTSTDDELRLVAGVVPLAGGADCPSNPPTPVQVELAEPLGDRTVVDAGRLPALEVQRAPADLTTDG